MLKSICSYGCIYKIVRLGSIANLPVITKCAKVNVFGLDKSLVLVEHVFNQQDQARFKIAQRVDDSRVVSKFGEYKSL